MPRADVAMALRLKGMQRAFREFNVPEENQTHFVLNEETDYARSVQYLDEALAKRPKPDCLICGNDRVALVAYQHLLSLGIRIPKDIGILGFDNMVGIGGLFLPPLSTIALEKPAYRNTGNDHGSGHGPNFHRKRSGRFKQYLRFL